MNLRQLRYFKKIVEVGGFSAASRELHVAQPALSQNIAALEEHLDVHLLERTAKGVVPTVEGELLYKHAAAILRQLEQAEAEVRSTSTRPQGKVEISLPFTLSGLVTPRLLRKVCVHYPDIVLEINDLLSVAAAEYIETGRTDFGLLPNAEDIDNIEAVPVYKESLYLIGMPTSGKPRAGTIRFASIADRPLVMPRRSTKMRQRIEQTALAEKVRLNVAFEANSNDTVRSIVRAGLASTIMPPYLFDHENDRKLLSIQRIVAPVITRTLSIVWSRKRPLSPAAKAVDGLLRQILGQLSSEQLLPGDIMQAS